jgi:hypothetical protein
MTVTNTPEKDKIGKRAAERSKKKETSGLKCRKLSSKSKKEIVHYVGKIKETASKTIFEISFLRSMRNRGAWATV